MKQYEEDLPKIWGKMESKMSKESLDAVKAKPDYVTLKCTFNVCDYLKLIKQVHRTEPAVNSNLEAGDDAREQFAMIKQKSDESLVDYKARIIAAVERIETVDASSKPDDKTIARKFTRGLDLSRFEELVRECREDDTKYAATLSEAHHQASAKMTLSKGKLVPCETVSRGANVAGAATEIKGLSKREYKMIMQVRKQEKQPGESSDNKRPGKKRGRDAEEDEDNVAAAGTAKNTRKKSNNNHNNRNNNHNQHATTEEGNCTICNRSNHTTENCYHLTRCREMVQQHRQQRQQQFSSTTSGSYQPQYQSNYSNGPAHLIVPGRQVYYGNNNIDSNLVYPGRGNYMKPFGQS